MLDTKWLLLLLWQLWSTSTPVAQAFDYCDPALCPGPEKHIACNNFGELADSCSPDAHVVRITPTRRNMILNELNEYRDRIARGDLLGFSPATRMATLQWDPELASFAELNVKRCALVNDHCRNSEQFRNVAQVVAEGGWQGSPERPDPASATDRTVEYHTEDEVIKATLEQMFAEYKECTMRDIIAYSPPISRILHLRISKCIAYFTQLVRDSTTHVGCGILRESRNTSNEAGRWLISVHQYMTCNFVRASDVNAPVYQSGDRSATDCRSGRNPIFINLCSVNEIYDTSSIMQGLGLY
ncbi:venom allergen 3 isoform X1 [Drosophila persimilis]|uniref:Antigen 5 like allergen Cul n 1 isoform X1 n=1 Tax=Drosophila pseudoobscura pseudoobscura TaxID=46245 RepID=A0A6I8V7U1_DROPS|nr:antigen 5 like allergen Cul n 1 isoform X1 [Drosophila pseudoobscura]XP_026841876.1 venom allergen 3 isoform X1 [Drosophila persimilis]